MDGGFQYLDFPVRSWGMDFSTEDVARLADLARLELSPEEAETTKKELQSVIGFIDRLQKVDTTDIPPMTMPAKSIGWREDVASPCSTETREQILNNFPSRKGDLLCTPGVFEKPKGGK